MDCCADAESFRVGSQGLLEMWLIVCKGGMLTSIDHRSGACLGYWEVEMSMLFAIGIYKVLKCKQHVLNTPMRPP